MDNFFRTFKEEGDFWSASCQYYSAIIFLIIFLAFPAILMLIKSDSDKGSAIILLFYGFPTLYFVNRLLFAKKNNWNRY